MSEVKRYSNARIHATYNGDAPGADDMPSSYVNAASFDALASALRALGVCGEGYCFCATNRDPAKADHEGECVEARRALGEAT